MPLVDRAACRAQESPLAQIGQTLLPLGYQFTGEDAGESSAEIIGWLLDCSMQRSETGGTLLGAGSSGRHAAPG